MVKSATRWLTPVTNTDPRSHADDPRPTSIVNERILLVDDEDVLRRLARSVLTRQGYEVVDASDPVGAVAIAEEQPDSFDLILADVMMPGMRGYEMVRQIRPHQRRAKVLYMSGYAGGIEAISGVVTPLLPKPFRPRQLLDEIRRILDTPA